MTTIHIIYSRFLGEKNQLLIGGIESYIHLIAMALKDQAAVKVYQPTKGPSKSQFVFDIIEVVGCGPLGLHQLVKLVEREYWRPGDIILFASDQYCSNTSVAPSIVIQHGIGWDVPMWGLTNKKICQKLETIYRLRVNLLNLWRVRKFKNIVCVDYNYVNWYRTFAPDRLRNKRVWIIPNTAGPHIEAGGEKGQWFYKDEREKKKVTISFIRRFTRLRGVYLAMNLAKKLTNRYDAVEFLFCGDGDEEIIKKIDSLCLKNKAVKRIICPYSEIDRVYRRSDIVIIPSLGSEGSSLAAIEAMAAGKCVVASNVGGLTNIIIDSYNGVLVGPRIDEFYYVLARLVEKPEEHKQIGERAYEVYRRSFSFSRWQEKWIGCVNEVLEQARSNL